MTAATLDMFGAPEEATTKWGVLFSAKTDEWPTPQDVVDEWARRVGPFTLDVAADAKNAKAARFYTLERDGLAQDWLKDAGGGAIWINPPYSDVEPFVAKAIAESARGATVVMLLPARTDTRWFHLVLAVQDRAELWFLRGRLRFGDAKNSAPFPSMVVVFRPRRK